MATSLIGPAIGAGFGIADLIKGPSKAQKATQGGLETNIDTARQTNADLTKSSTGLISSGQDKVGTAGNYFTGVLGNRAQALSAADPEISTIMDQFDAAHKAAAELSPRGGGRATLNAQKPYQMSGQIGKLLQASRGNAASILSNLGINEEGLGIQEGGQAISALNAGTSAANALGENEAGYQKQKGSEFGAIGSGIGGLLGKLLADKKSGSTDGGD